MAAAISPHMINDIIQLSVAPVFLLVAIGSLLNVMTQRLGRIIDRARILEQGLNPASSEQEPPDRENAHYRKELAFLDQRMTCSHWAINFCALAALLIASLVALIFFSDLAGFNAVQLIGVLFTLAMTSVIVGLCFFLTEIYIATKTVRVQTELLKS